MNLPEMIILDTGPDVKKFKEGLGSHETSEFYARDTINSIVNCLNDKSMADYELREYVAQIEFGVYDAIEEIGVELDQRRMVANLKEAERVLDLGMEIKKTIEAMGLYLPDGSLPYHFDEERHEEIQGPISFIILKRV